MLRTKLIDQQVKSSQNSGGGDVFQHRCTISGEVTHFPENGVVVSALKYVPQLKSLLVGFNFGSWQILDISSDLTKNSVVAFSSAYVSESALPVTAFVFQVDKRISTCCNNGLFLTRALFCRSRRMTRATFAMCGVSKVITTLIRREKRVST